MHNSVSPTGETNKPTLQSASQKEAVIAYKKSDMKLVVHSIVEYQNKKNALSSKGGTTFFPIMATTPHNEAIFDIAQILKVVILLGAVMAVHPKQSSHTSFLQSWVTNYHHY